MNEVVQQILAGVAGVIAVSSLIFAIVGAVRSGVIRRLNFKLGPLEIEATPQERKAVRELIASVTETSAEKVPFETEQIALYYSQVLGQSKISFWFSLVFASLGFVVIIVAAFLYTSANSGAAIIQLIAGAIIDSVAGLFFVQSRGAQKAMMEFFEKLRLDRQQLESRKLCEEIQDPGIKDALRVNLSLHYAGIEKSHDVSKAIVEGTRSIDKTKGKSSTQDTSPT